MLLLLDLDLDKVNREIGKEKHHELARGKCLGTNFIY